MRSRDALTGGVRRTDTGAAAAAADTTPVRRPADLRLALGIAAAILAAMMPLLRVVAPGAWLPGAGVVAGGILAVGYLVRRRGLPSLAATGIELACWLLALTFAFLPASALFWIVPTPESVHVAAELVRVALTQIQEGTAPLDAGEGLSFLLVGSIGLLAIILDHVVMTARMPLLAAVGLVAVWLIPALAVPSGMNVLSFAVLAAAILYLLRAETRARHAPPRTPPSERIREAGRPRSGVGATAFGIGAIAIVVAVAVSPLLPQPTRVGAAGGLGAPATIDASLELGSDLRRSRKVQVMTVDSNAPDQPYLRIVTLSRFDGREWDPDEADDVVPLTAESLGPVTAGEGIRVTEYRTSVTVTNLSSSWLPVPYPAVAVEGLDGEWEAVPHNRTVVTGSANAFGQTYDVITHVPRPTREQIQATQAGGLPVSDPAYEVPTPIPAAIEATALERTAAAETDYDKLVALQSWFRSADFEYSLRSPVEQGFDGSGVDAIAEFLEERQGYCVHYAATFALMARTLGMPARIVEGYLPGTSTGRFDEGNTIYEIMSDQLHAWPEVHFEGIGWVPFEPTNSLGSPTSFLPAAAPQGVDRGQDITVDEAASAAPTATADPAERPDEEAFDEQSLAGGGQTGTPLAPGVLVLLGVAALLAVPGLAREILRLRRLAAARRGDAAAAWRLVRATAVDLGIPVPAPQSPRAFGAVLTAHHAPADAVGVLVDAIEHASYAPAGRREQADLADAASTVHVSLLAGSPRGVRALAMLLPRSLVVRPGSAYAAA